MTYVAVGHLYGGDVESMLHFCNVITRSTKPFHAFYLEQRLLRKLQLWPVYIEAVEIAGIVGLSYEEAFRRHIAQKSAGPLPNRIQYFGCKVMRYRPYNMKTIVTLEMAYTPAILSVQGQSFETVQEYARKAGIGPVFAVDDDRVFFPSEILNLQVPLGMVLQHLGK